MSRSSRQGGGLSIAARFALTTSVVLAIVMGGAGMLLFQKSADVIEASNQATLRDVALAQEAIREHDGEGPPYKQETKGKDLGGGVGEFDVEVHVEPFTGRGAKLYSKGETNIVAPAPAQEPAKDLKALFFVVTALVIIAGGGASAMVATQVSKPLAVLVDDVRAIARGNLGHKTRVRAGGEVGHLARAIDRMAADLADAQDAEVELGVREREKEVARDVASALLPDGTPSVPGAVFCDVHEPGAEIGGGFHEYVTCGGRQVAIVCEVTGEGIPAALIGATARAYLRSEFERSESIDAALSRVNERLAGDLRPGLAVSLVCVGVVPDGDVVEVCSAGHKLPIVRFDAAEGKASKLHPEGFALGFEKGPAFARTLEVLRIPFLPGDRLMFASEIVARVAPERGDELGEAGWLKAAVQAMRARPEKAALAALAAVQDHADGADFPVDLSIVSISREA